LVEREYFNFASQHMGHLRHVSLLTREGLTIFLLCPLAHQRSLDDVSLTSALPSVADS
jgi:hypothetical protein